jgi:hypothetical protein
MEYEIAANTARRPRRIAMLAEKDVAVVPLEGLTVFPPCEGDRRTRLGMHDCSRQAIRFDGGGHSDVEMLRIVVAGNKAPSQSSIVIKNGPIEKCAIASLGIDLFDVNAQVRTSEEISFKGCKVTIPTNPLTGDGEPGTISGANCAFVANAVPVSAAELRVDGKSVGNLTFGDAAVSSGAASCTTKVISRKLYTWCTCDDVNGDGIPDDPIPPCPATLK